MWQKFFNNTSGKKALFVYPPPALVFSVTTRCNFSCPHCLRQLVDSGKTVIKDLPISVFEMALKGGKKIGFKKVAFTGGEPILHPQFREMVELIKKYNYDFRIVSNGWFYKDYLPIINSAKKNFDAINFSLDGATAEVHDSFRNKPGSFERIMEAIKLYQQNQIPIILVTCLNKKNYDQIEKIVNLCLGFKIKWLRVTLEMPVPNSGLTDEELLDMARRIVCLREKFKNQVFISPCSSFFQKDENRRKVINFCSILKDGPHPLIDQDGGMIFCCDIFQKCSQKPLIQKEGFEKSYRITLNVINEIKKQRLRDLLNNPEEATGTCDYCNKYIGKVLERARKTENEKTSTA